MTFEYKTIDLYGIIKNAHWDNELVFLLNQEGRNGWELVFMDINFNICILKRKSED